MTFKFYGQRVTFTDGKLHADDEFTYAIISPLVGCASGAPEDGDPLLNTITAAFGNGSVTDVVRDDEYPYLIH